MGKLGEGAYAMKIVGGANPFDTNEKRFYVPGVTLEGICPECTAILDLEGAKKYHPEKYMAYQRANAPATAAK